MRPARQFDITALRNEHRRNKSLRQSDNDSSLYANGTQLQILNLNIKLPSLRGQTSAGSEKNSSPRKMKRGGERGMNVRKTCSPRVHPHRLVTCRQNTWYDKQMVEVCVRPAHFQTNRLSHEWAPLVTIRQYDTSRANIRSVPLLLFF